MGVTALLLRGIRFPAVGPDLRDLYCLWWSPVTQTLPVVESLTYAAFWPDDNMTIARSAGH